MSELHKRKREVIEAIGTLHRDGKNTFQNYKYLSDVQIIEAVRHELYLQDLNVHVTMPSPPVPVKLDPKGWHHRVHIQMTLSYFSQEKAPMESKMWGEVSDWYGEAADSSDKSIQKAATSAFKYLLMKTFLISGTDDPDAASPDVSESSLERMINAVSKGLDPVKAAERWDSMNRGGELASDEFNKGMKYLEGLGV